MPCEPVSVTTLSVENISPVAVRVVAPRSVPVVSNVAASVSSGASSNAPVEASTATHVTVPVVTVNIREAPFYAGPMRTPVVGRDAAPETVAIIATAPTTAPTVSLKKMWES